jgi:uncharacterized protein
MSGSGAMAIFVKTPGLSPVKTRLAVEIGTEEARTFYLACVAAAEAVALRASVDSALDAYWAVAEEEALANAMWSRFRVTPQGKGDLGDRLARVYTTLLDEYPFVLLLGADAPLLSAELIAEAAEALRRNDVTYVISRSADGGYSLFGGRAAIPRELWRSVPYSSAETAVVFVEALQQYGEVLELPCVDDVDTLADLATLTAVAAGRLLLPQQAAVIELARELLAGASGEG